MNYGFNLNIIVPAPKKPMMLFLQRNFYISKYAAWDAILEYYNIFILEREEILIFRPQEMKIVDL